jgi:hypothetical protein
MGPIINIETVIKSLFMAMYLSVVAWRGPWAGRPVLAGPGTTGPDMVIRRAMTIVDEASLSAATLGGVVVLA